MGRPNRRNNLMLYVNPNVIPVGSCIRFTITKHTGGVELIDNTGAGVQHVSVKLDAVVHNVRGQSVFRVALPWRGTAWNQHATVEAVTKSGANSIRVEGRIRVDETNPNEAGFFKRVDYDELDDQKPSQFAAGVITVNTLDPLNKIVFGSGTTKENARKEFDKRLSEDPKAQQRLASILLEEASFRALQQLHDDNKLHLPQDREIAEIHEQIDKYKFVSAIRVYRALAR